MLLILIFLMMKSALNHVTYPFPAFFTFRIVFFDFSVYCIHYTPLPRTSFVGDEQKSFRRASEPARLSSLIKYRFFWAGQLEKKSESAKIPYEKSHSEISIKNCPARQPDEQRTDLWNRNGSVGLTSHAVWRCLASYTDMYYPGRPGSENGFTRGTCPSFS